jgi:hypothetical protein
VTDANEGPASSNESGPAPFVSPTLARLAGRCLLRGAVVGVAASFVTFAIMLGEFAVHADSNSERSLPVSAVVGLLGALLGLWSGAVGLIEGRPYRTGTELEIAVASALAWVVAFAALWAAMLNAIYIGGTLQHWTLEGGVRELRAFFAEMSRGSRLSLAFVLSFAAFSFPFAPATWARLRRLSAPRGAVVSALSSVVVCTPLIGYGADRAFGTDARVLVGLLVGLAVLAVSLPFLLALADQLELRIAGPPTARAG